MPSPRSLEYVTYIGKDGVAFQAIYGSTLHLTSDHLIPLAAIIT